jgi:lipopolysaccharide export system permease protein
MKIIDRYLVTEYLRNLMFITASFLCLFLIIDFFEKIRMFLSNHATVAQMGSYFLFRMPMIISQVLPAAVLVASLVTCGTLSKHSEITAMKANGISLYRIAFPILVIAAVTSATIFLLGEWVTPYTNDRAEHIRLIEVQKQPSMGSFKQDQIWYRGQKGIYNFRFFDVRTNTLQGITIHYLDRQMNLVMRLDAEKGEWQGGRWLFHNVLIARFESGRFPLLTKLREQFVDLPESPADFKVVQKDVEVMGYFELKRYIEKLQAEGYDASRYVVDLHGKLAFPWVSIILAMIGVSFALRSERHGGVAQGIGIGLIIGFSYWLVYAFGLSMGRSGILPPLLSAWFANAVFVAAAMILVPRVRT